MSITVYVPRDTTALACGAEAVVRAIESEASARGLDVRLVRNGSRGLYWLEPLVEVATPAGRVGYGPVTEDDVANLFDAGFLDGAAHTLAHGRVDDIPYLASQQRLCFARNGIIDPLDLDDYQTHGGWKGLLRAVMLSPEAIVQCVLDSGLRGRGGAAFPAGIKWKTVLGAQAGQKYIVCNADEGDSGTYSDRMVFEGDPYRLIEGMTIAGIATGATMGYVYLRSEYPLAFTLFREAIERARAAGSVPTSRAADTRSSSRCASARARTSAARRPRCSKASKASAARSASSRRCRR